MAEKTCHNCGWYERPFGVSKEYCMNPDVDHVMSDGTCPEWEKVDPDGDTEHKQLANSYAPNAWDEWKRNAEKKNLKEGIWEMPKR